MNPSRLAELERQRALVRTHLAWLDQEIAREAASASSVGAAESIVRPFANVTVAPAPQAGATAFDDYQPDAKNAAQSAKRGCLFVAIGAFVLLVSGFVALYFYRYSDRPLLFPSRAEANGAVKK